MTTHAVIMAGGAGTRFWPASRGHRPKQFLPLCDGKPLLQTTVERLAGTCAPDRIWIVTNPRLARRLPKVLKSFPRQQVIVEPEARDTAPCVALAAATIGAIDARATMIVLPADHVIAPTSEFERMLQRGVELAADDRTLVTFGVPPTGPATGYGYLECGAPFDDREPQALRALRFREKPDAATARQFVAAGNFLWNSGIFVWTVPGIRAAMLAADPALAAAEAGMLAARQQGRPAAVARAFRQAPKTSIDFAVMERAPSVVVVRATVNWDDVGSFTALPSVAPTDALGNTALLAAGATQIVCQSQQNIVYAEGRRTVALFGVRDLVVVAVDDAVLVCPREQAQDLKTLIARVRAEGREDLL